MGSSIGISRSVVVAVACVGLSASLVYWVARPRSNTLVALPSAPPEWGTPREHMQAWSKAPSLSAEDGEIVATLDAAVEPPLAESVGIDARQHELLVKTLGDYLSAYVSDSPDAYLELAKSENTKWIVPTDSAWLPIDHATRFVYGRPADRAQPEAALRDLLAHYRFSPERRYVRFGTGPAGMRIVVEFVRTANAANMDLLHERHGSREAQYWAGGAGQSFRFRNPRRSLDDVIRAHGGTMVAQSVIMVFNEAGRPGIWRSHWYWDPRNGEWLNSASWIQTAHRDMGGMFY